MCSAKELKSHPGAKLVISEGAVISSRGDTMRRPGAMELWSPPRRDNHLIKIGLLFPRYSIFVWTYLIYNSRQWVSRPGCNTPIALGLPLPLLSRPSLGQISGPLVTWEHRNTLKDGGDVYIQSHICEHSMYIPLLGTEQGAGPSRTSLSKSGYLQYSNTCKHHQKAKGHCIAWNTILYSTSGICSFSSWTQARVAVGGHPPFGSLWRPGVDRWHRTMMYISAEI